jgi:phosphohistidine phosphatase
VNVYFVRHGLANWPADQWSGDDARRPLTAKGERQIEAVGAALAGRDLRLERILHSPLVRARQTAEIIAGRLALTAHVRAQAGLAPGFNARLLQALLRDYSDAVNLMLIGHNPDLAEVVTALTNTPVQFREGTVACLRLTQPERASLVWLATADELAAEQ